VAIPPGIFLGQSEGVLRRECIQDDQAGLAEEFTDVVNQDGSASPNKIVALSGRAEAVSGAKDNANV
jgi:hypothetical protein